MKKIDEGAKLIRVWLIHLVCVCKDVYIHMHGTTYKGLVEGSPCCYRWVLGCLCLLYSVGLISQLALGLE